ncbi:MAG: hypothetical protein PUP93_16505 [Rhizonema sp. NSF051]|nr:hypothetical protein [Rhizonema sp. NSF051]
MKTDQQSKRSPKKSKIQQESNMHLASLISIQTTTKSKLTKSANRESEAVPRAIDSALVYSARSTNRIFLNEKENPSSVIVSPEIERNKSHDFPKFIYDFVLEITAKKETVFSTTLDAKDRQQAIALILDRLNDSIDLSPDKPIPQNCTITSLTVTCRIEFVEIPFPEDVRPDAAPISFTSEIKPKISHSACQHTMDESLEAWRTVVGKSYNLTPIESAYVFYKPYCDPHDSTSKRIAEALAMRNARQ